VLDLLVRCRWLGAGETEDRKQVGLVLLSQKVAWDRHRESITCEIPA
jgi:hypothetical protein